ncbi:hypothetical protein [Desulfonatronum thioautotrophicum]|uniref:hypothetical protein n=1 Tax=Desulfonatronum thioautotrophicum TaxID=617001 RepID=UPI0012947542|nr:hypothetical protein [Desulfonatronum thioautotrophicum]
MKFLLDTNVIIEAVGGSDHAKAALREAVFSEWVGFSSNNSFGTFQLSRTKK